MYTDVRLLTMYLRRLFAKGIFRTVQSIVAQCSMSRTVCAIRHGCRWFQTETSFLLCKKLAVKNVQECIVLTNALRRGMSITIKHFTDSRHLLRQARGSGCRYRIDLQSGGWRRFCLNAHPCGLLRESRFLR